MQEPMTTAQALGLLRQVAEQHRGSFEEHLALQEALKVLESDKEE